MPTIMEKNLEYYFCDSQFSSIGNEYETVKYNNQIKLKK